MFFGKFVFNLKVRVLNLTLVMASNEKTDTDVERREYFS